VASDGAAARAETQGGRGGPGGEPVAPFSGRICTEPVEYRGVARFPADSIVAISAGRANREQPGGEDFDITAPRDGQLDTFGAGAHCCLGANLARAELEEALAFLAPRMPGLAFSGPEIPGGPAARQDRSPGLAAIVNQRAPTRRAAHSNGFAPHRDSEAC